MQGIVRDVAVSVNVNVAIGEDYLIVRTFGYQPSPDQSLMKTMELLGNGLHNVLYNLPAVGSVDWFADAFWGTPMYWMKANRMGSPDDKEGVFVQQGVLHIRRDKEVLGSGFLTDQAVLDVRRDRQGRLRLINRTLHTLQGRSSPYVLTLEDLQQTVLTLHLPYADTKFTDGNLLIRAAHSMNVWHNIDAKLPEYETDDPQIADYEPKPAFVAKIEKTSKKGSSQEFKIDVEVRNAVGKLDTACNSIMYVEAILGYAVCKRIQIEKGRGSFRALALGLGAGDTMHLKLGWRSYPGIHDVVIPIT